MANLTAKERYLLEDQKKQEELCIKKYNNYANQATDPQLKDLLFSHEKQEKQHLDTINKIINGQVPDSNQSQQQNQQPPSFSQSNFKNQKDSDICEDLLSTEKYVSSTYNTAIFEFRDHNIRMALNHIQKEEQEHGEDLFRYMQSNGIYNPQ